ncbi:transcription antitermination factor NusB [candidate division GN15 bacterium]|uniref:Transcription antitermination protein NusB n=1 Tax=candidate division GN15 bacterium TaxID=2072418 RepID=A0A855XCH9_9BACT|nr:MAG: transcription antitermination factor NusB [candidate division GN15 bacterium]
MTDAPRRRARELVLQALYACDVGENDPDDVKQRIIADDSLSARNLEFARGMFALVREHQNWADEQITQLATNWDINRIAELDRIVLRMAIVELNFMPDTPVKVAINEAIELAKRFSTGESSSFINGILDSFAKKVASR